MTSPPSHTVIRTAPGARTPVEVLNQERQDPPDQPVLPDDPPPIVAQPVTTDGGPGGVLLNDGIVHRVP